MKISKLFSIAFFSIFLSSQVFSADWKQTGDLPNDPTTEPLFLQIVTDAKGQSTAVWQETVVADPPLGLPKAATLKEGTNKWIATSKITDYPNEKIILPQALNARNQTALTISKDGLVAFVYAAYLNKSSSTVVIQSTFLTPGSQTWEQTKTVAKFKSKFKRDNLTSPTIAFDNNSRLYVVYTDFSSGVRQLKSAYLDLGATTWSSPTLISTKPLNQKFDNLNPVLATSPEQDRLVVIWDHVTNKQQAKGTLYGSYLDTAANTWSKPKQLSGTNKITRDIYAISQLNSGTQKNYALLAWVEDDVNMHSTLQYATLDGANEWTTHSLFKTQHTNTLGIAIDKDQNTTIVFDELTTNTPSRILATNIPINGNPSTPIKISGSRAANNPVVNVDPSNKSIAIWAQALLSGNNAVFSADHPESKEWSSAKQISTQGRDENVQSYLSLATNVLGQNTAIWSELSGSNYLIRGAIRGGTLPPPLPPVLPPKCINGSQGKDKFLLQTTHYNVVTWCKSPSKNISKYNLYRNGVLIHSTTADQSLTYRDDDLKEDTSYTYTVKAVNKEGILSKGVQITLP